MRFQQLTLYSSAVLLLFALVCALAVGQTADTALEVCRPATDESTDQGIGILDDPTCATDKNGCISSHCRMCQFYPTPISTKYLPCTAPIKLPDPVVIVPAPAPVVWTPGPVTSAPVTSAPVTSAPVTSAPVTSAPVTPAPQTPESASNIGFAALPSVSGGSDSSVGNADEPLAIVASVLNADDVDAPVGTMDTWITCKTGHTAVEAVEHGLRVVTDVNCQLPDGKFPYGCFSSMCRYCRSDSGTIDTNYALATCM